MMQRTLRKDICGKKNHKYIRSHGKRKIAKEITENAEDTENSYMWEKKRE